ncbi:MAG: hypothetical protein WBG71_12910 [Leeuwenhoekiella sp.]
MIKRTIFSGMALGGLIGLIIGLSIAEVTGIILGALTSLLAAFFGLRPDKEGETGDKWIIGWFSLGCVLTITGGIMLRTHNFLAPPVGQDIEIYREIGFTNAEIKEVILAREFGLITSDRFTYNEQAAARASKKSTLLMAGEDDLPLCLEITEATSVEDMLDAYNASGGTWSRTAADLKRALPDTSALKTRLLELKTTVCAGE